MKKIKNYAKKIPLKQLVAFMLICGILFLLSSQSAFATNKIIESSIFKGTKLLLQDITSAIQIISGVAAIVMIGIIYLKDMFNKSEPEEKETYHRTKVIVRALVVVFLASTIVNLILSYYTTKRVEEVNSNYIYQTKVIQRRI